jgi:hypothetical protein
MVETPESLIPGLKSHAQVESVYSPLSFEQVGRLQMQASLDKMNTQLKEERHKESLKSLIGFWPLGVGLVMACLAPLLSDILTPIKPWGMGLVFPFVVLSERPELHLSSYFAATVPQVMLYAQFPIEALIAKIGSKGRVTLFEVAMRVATLQVLAIALLFLLNQAIG